MHTVVKIRLTARVKNKGCRSLGSSLEKFNFNTDEKL